MDQRLATLHNALQQERTQEAAALCEVLLQETPHNVELLCAAASLAHRQGELTRAFDLSARALAADPRLPQLHNNLGVVLHDLGRSADALSSFDAALALAPEYAEAYCNRGNALRALGRGSEALAAYRASIGHDPEFAQAYCNLGNALRAEGQWQEAVECYRKLLALDPQRREGWLNLCGALMIVGELREALHAARRAVRLAPHSVDAHWNLSLALLALGEYREGWQEYQWRLRDQLNFPPRFAGIPPWDGSDPAGRTILLAAEQGLGDALQFIRYAPLLAQAGARVVVECRSELLPFFARQKGIEAVFPLGETPPCDCYAYLMSLPHLFRTELASVPAQVPYLAADPALASLWQGRLCTGADLKVGVVWAGSAGYRNDRHRSLAAALLSPLSATPGVTLYSLQLGRPRQELSEASLPLVDLAPEIGSFADTAAVVEQLDLIISVDTAVAHLAGAMGKPVWLLLPKGGEWRWLSEREDSPWYPTMRLFRQTRFGAWDEVVQRVAAELTRESRDIVRLFRKGNALANEGKRYAAIAAYRRVIELEPGCAEAYSNLGLALHDEGLLAEAAQSYRSALALKPALPHAANNLGTLLNALDEREEAVASFRRALELAPDFLPAALNLGSALQYLERPQEALAVYGQALQRHPASLEARINLGTAYQDLALPQQAVATYEEALTLNPASAEAHWNLSLNLLMAGDYPRGWREYEWRLRTGEGNLAPATWEGAPLAGETVLLRCEQGLGDTLQFVRYAPLVARRGGRVVVECQGTALKPLLRGVTGVAEVYARGEQLPPAHYTVPLLSLPRIFGTTLANIPSAPYLAADSERQESWRRRFQGDAGFKIGLVWQGGPLPRNRACPFHFFAPLGAIPGVSCYSLQLGASPDAALLPVCDLAPEIRDFADTAAIVANLDLVLTVDTAVAHLAGGMGAPAWLLLPHVADWRWLMGRDDSPWYPGMRLFRQDGLGDWGSAMKKVCAALQRIV